MVTAEKRSERLENVPISISAVTSTQLHEANITQVLDLPQAVPALRITYSGTFVQPTIRGVGSQVALPGLPQNIATYLDGYYVPDPAADNFSLIDVSSVAVLKGPQGTLFGYDATGGAIQISTLQPQQQPSVIARVSYGSYNDVAGAFYGTTGIAPTLSANIAAGYERGDGYIKNLVTGKNADEFHKWYIRSKLLWTPTDKINFTLAYAHTYDNDPKTQDVVARNDETIAIAVPGAIIPTDRGVVALNDPSYARFSSDSITLTSSIDLNLAKLTSYTGYRTDKVEQALDYDASSAPLNNSNWNVPDKTFTQELDLTSPGGGKLNWVLGGFYMHYTDSYDYNTEGTPIFTSKNTTESYAAFGDATYEIIPHLFLTAGGRYSADNPGLAFDLIPYGLVESGDAWFHDFSARGVARYQLTPASNIYASFTQGYKAGGLPASAFSLTPVKPEHIDAYEVGYKTAEGPIRFNVAGFYYDYKDVQVTSYGAGGASITANAAAAHIYGVDADLTWKVSPDLNFIASAGYTHAQYQKFTNAITTSQDLDPASPTYGAISQSLFDASGYQVERTPKFSGSLAANYGFDMAGGRILLNANLFYSSKFYFDVAEQLPQKSYALLNLRATWTDPSGRFDVSVYGTNVTGTKYYISSFIDPYAARSVYGDPALFGGSITYHY